jgi:hypothetical protein
LTARSLGRPAGLPLDVGRLTVFFVANLGSFPRGDRRTACGRSAGRAISAAECI